MSGDYPLLTLLLEVEKCLRHLERWSDEEPTQEALLSSEPFALDTLSAEQWLQWIFLPKMREMIENNQVPKGFAITPYFEEVWQAESEKAHLLSILNAIDEECR